MERFGTLSFGHYGPLGGGRMLTAGDSMKQAIDLAQGMDDLGVDGTLLPRAPLRATAGLADAAAGGDRGDDEAHRGRHGRDRHALREPAVPRRRGCGRRPDQRRQARARRQPRFTRVGRARVRDLRLHRFGGSSRRRHRSRALRDVPAGDRRRGTRRARCPQPVRRRHRPAAYRAALPRAALAHLVGRRQQRVRRVGGQRRA